ncbi:axin isoform X1 [Leptopilina heterotoma]|uniref:axin isoform X1 n=1 Tax=Leptopilina heterotoma TaxID=63436 RepID=UPI001CA8189A|nr:axin isoform X1 [Leptopilina heterotoma]XP_043479226.1 axin isoform X1 [Leptopilina heterotoma]XP_043479228.1 axin isoform X1 [Leptopilina heterotoma]XP_043479229.1 axin isoform X1 [Leptopilina heterotoma]
MSGPRQSEARSFNEKCPRPPVPGGETEKFTGACNLQSPALTPRRSSLVRPSISSYYDASAPLGFEPEGSCGATIMESDPRLPCLQWAKNLHNLLHDPEGLELFRKYLDQEGRPHVNPLNFWFACEGLKKQRDAKQIYELIKLIHGRFFVKSQLQIPEEVRKEANRRVKEGLVDKMVFNVAQLQVEHLINETTYPNFLRSDTYLQYVQSCQNPDPGGCPSPGSSREMSLSCGPNTLPTLFEDSEFISSMHVPHTTSSTSMEMTREVKLTEEVLMRTQQVRALDFKRKPEAFAGIYLQPGANPYHVTRMHAQYSSYNPVSRQDSELQSVSSDARTESDTMSLNGSSIDGMSIGKSFASKKQYSRQHRAMKESASKNRDNLDSMIPRTQRMTRDVNQPQDPESFAHRLIQKLEIVKRQQENGERLSRHLQDPEMMSFGEVDVESSGGPLTTGNIGDSRGIFFTDQLRQNLFIDDDNDQAILDQHVSRVWADSTPSRSPHGLASPPPRLPERRRPQHAYSRSSKQRRDKDVFSTFSIDSGNIHDFPEGSDLIGAGSMSSLGSHLPKSKSVPSDYADSLHKHDFYLQGREQRMKKAEIARRSTTKKSLTELTDSGVSVLSEASSLPRDRRLLSWLKDSDKGSDVKYVRQQLNLYGSRSGSLERSNQDMLAPAQPFVADPGMPPLPQPHTDTQLEEAKRRLLPLMEDDRGRGNNRQRYPGNKQVYEQSAQSPSCSYSNQSTLRKTKQEEKDFTTVVFNFCDEQYPYRTKIPGRNITLKQFKEILHKKGSYRYFFKTECEDLDVKVIQEEITDDAEILPLWEGKIMAEVKSLE